MVDVSPYLAVVAITNGGVTKTASGFDPTNMEFNLLGCRISQSYGSLISRLTIEIEDSDASFYNFFRPGGTYSIQWGKTVPSLSVLTKGFVERRVVKRPDKNTMTYELTCFDRNAVLDRRMVNVNRFQKRLSSGGLDTSDDSMDIGNLAKYVIGYDKDGSTANTDAYYPMNGVGPVKTIAAEHNITVGGVQTANQKLPTFNAEYLTAGSTLKQLAEYLDWIAYIDETDTLQFKPASTDDSGILITDTESPSWDTTKVAHIIDDQEMTIEESLEDTKNMIIGIGGEMNDTPNYSQTSVSGGSDTLYDKYIAFKLPRIKDVGITSVAVRVSRTGQPDIDLFGEIREDNGGTPQGGAPVKGFQIPKSSIGTSHDWALGDLVTDINTQVDHWLILYMDNSGTGSAAKTYNWHHDGGSSGSRATSTDGSTWTVTGSTKQYGFLVWTDARIVSLAYDLASMTAYGQRDMVLRDDTIKTLSTMNTRISRLRDSLKYPKQVVTAAVYPPDTILKVGKLVTVQESKSAINGVYRVSQIDYIINDTGAFSMEVQAGKVY